MGMVPVKKKNLTLSLHRNRHVVVFGHLLCLQTQRGCGDWHIDSLSFLHLVYTVVFSPITVSSIPLMLPPLQHILLTAH